ncbi:MAG: phosphatase PAP2 family protein [Holosporales bacterium]
MKFNRIVLPIILTVASLISSASAGTTRCRYQNLKDSNWSKFADKTQAIPGIAAIGFSLYHKDWDGLIRLLALEVGKGYAKKPMKKAVKKKRPCGCNEGGFPSGHALLSFGGSSYIHYRYGLKYAIPFYVLSTFTGYSRVKTKSHDAIDVIASAAIANVVTWLVVPSYEEHRAWIIPFAQPSRKAVGVAINYRF